MSLNFTLGKNEKVKHHIRTKTHKFIILKFWIESDVNDLCGWTQVPLVLYLSSEPPPLKNSTSGIRVNG